MMLFNLFVQPTSFLRSSSSLSFHLPRMFFSQYSDYIVPLPPLSILTTPREGTYQPVHSTSLSCPSLYKK